MALDLSALTAYTDQEKMGLIRKSILTGKTMSLITVQPDIKSSAAINILSSTALFQAGACGFNPLGTTTLDQRLLTVVSIKQNEPICVESLEAYWTQSLMKAGSYNEEIPFEQLYAEEKAAQSSKELETMLWQGDTAGATGGNLDLVDGFIKIIDADAGTITGTALALDSANIVDAVDEMVAKVPDDAIQATDLTLFMGFDKYRIYTAALRNANLFHYDAQNGSDFEIFVPGTNVKVIAVSGLNNTGVAGAGRIFLTPASNMYAGVDMLNDSEDFRIFYAEEADEVRFNQKFKIGFQTAFGELVVSN
jgi:hypothetical protein